MRLLYKIGKIFKKHTHIGKKGRGKSPQCYYFNYVLQHFGLFLLCSLPLSFKNHGWPYTIHIVLFSVFHLPYNGNIPPMYRKHFIKFIKYYLQWLHNKPCGYTNEGLLIIQIKSITTLYSTSYFLKTCSLLPLSLGHKYMLYPYEINRQGLLH